MKETTDRRFPIGKFEYGKTYSLEDTRKQIKAIARLPKELKKIAKKLRDGALDRSYRAGGWTARQVIHHIADSHMNAYIRFKLAVTETAPIIKPYEEGLWAETEDAKHGSAKTSLKIIAALHARWVDFLRSLSDDDLDRGYYHPANKRTVSLREAIALYAWHSKHHLAHIKLVADGNAEKPVLLKKTGSVKSKGEKGDEKVANVSLEAGAKPNKRVMSEAHKAKIKAAQQARRATEKADKPASTASAPVATAPKKRGRPAAKAVAESQKRGTPINTSRSNIRSVASPEKPKRARRSSAEVAAEKAAKAALPKLSRGEILAKARAARKAAEKPADTAPKKAGRGRPAAKAPKAAAPEKPKRARRSSAEVAAEKAAKAAAPKLSRGEILAKARAARKAAEKPADTAPKKAGRGRPAAKAPKAAAPEKPKRARRSSAEVAAEKAAKAAQPKLSREEVMEKARAAAAAKRLAAGKPAKPKKDPNAPKLSRAEILEKARAARNKK